jgi:hypothetical protein
METHKPRTATINDLREWNERNELVLAPEFQRRKVWGPKARSFLIDTILNGFPIPAIHIRQKIDVKTKRTIREVVDGQQRLRAILDYIEDAFSVMKVHNKRYGGQKFSDLPTDVQERFLEYDLLVDFLVGATDADVLEVFARINSYTIVLNEQEKLNAEYSGKFKQLVFQLGREHLEFWRRNRILTNYGIMRMKEAELSTDLVIAMIDGIQDRKRIRSYYKKYDDDFPQEDTVKERFERIIDTIAAICGDSLSASQFANSTLFYSLFCALHDLSYGGLVPETPNVPITRETYDAVRRALSTLEKELTAKEPRPAYYEFAAASSRHTTDQSTRLIRHRTIVSEIVKELTAELK